MAFAFPNFLTASSPEGALVADADVLLLLGLKNTLTQKVPISKSQYLSGPKGKKKGPKN